MGTKVKGGSICARCGPVAAQRTTHRARNTASTVLAPITGGVSLAGTKSGQWHCPKCGGPVDEGGREAMEDAVSRFWFPALLLFFLGIVVAAVFAASTVAGIIVLVAIVLPLGIWFWAA